MFGSKRRFVRSARGTMFAASTWMCRTRGAVVVALAVAFLVDVVPCAAQQTENQASKPVAGPDELFQKYVVSTLGIPGTAHAVFAAGLEQWRDAPPEWGDGAKGFARRWASEYAESAIGDATKYGVARLLHHDPSFTKCTCTGFARRLRHAMASPFTARTRTGIGRAHV